MGFQNRATAYVSLGSNIGQREQTLQEAIKRLHQLDEVKVVASSSMYETEPVGYTEQPAFINMAIALETTLSPHQLLEAMLDVEKSLGRVREFQNGPRTIDLDLLMYDDVQLDGVELILPHPRMFERSFVLIPLAELMDAIQAEERFAITTSMLASEGKEGVTLWKKVNWQKESGHFAN